MKHWLLWRISPSYRRRQLEAFDRRFEAFWMAAAQCHLAKTPVGREALRRGLEEGA